MSAESGSRSWWQTLPGVLTAAAGIITAVTGLLVALHQIGVFADGGESPAARHADPVADPATFGGTEPGARVDVASGKGEAPAPSVLFPAGTEVRHGDVTYTILESAVRPYAPGSRSLTLDVRLTNRGPYPVNFWDASFRLEIDGLLRAPRSNLNELVEGNSSKEGRVEFVIPDDATRLGLQMGAVGEAAPALPVTIEGA